APAPAPAPASAPVPARAPAPPPAPAPGPAPAPARPDCQAAMPASQTTCDEHLHGEEGGDCTTTSSRRDRGERAPLPPFRHHDGNLRAPLAERARLGERVRSLTVTCSSWPGSPAPTGSAPLRPGRARPFAPPPRAAPPASPGTSARSPRGPPG